MAKILIIEDEKDILSEVTQWLRFEDYDVVQACNGKDGLEKAQEHKPDLVICDIRMPIMNGHEVLLQMRSHPELSQIPFIFATASAERSSVRTGMNLGADDYITKPYTFDEIINTVKVRLDKQNEEQKNVEHQLGKLKKALDQEVEQRILKSRLIGMFSHDFRNPLALIQSSSSLMLRYNDRLDEAMKLEKLHQITRSVNLLTQMLDDLLLVAEMDTPDFEPQPITVDIHDFISQIVHDFGDIYVDSHQINLESNVVSSIIIDPKLLRQAISNILSNALKYSPNSDHIRVKLRETKDAIEISVQDFGIGIPESSMPNLFTPFHRADNAKGFKGTGLGLALVKDAIDYCDGTIQVESTEGKGTTFIITLPVYRN